MIKQIWDDRRRIREESGLTQRAMAELLGLDPSQFYRLEVGINTPLVSPLGVRYLEVLISLEAELRYESRSSEIRPTKGKDGDVGTNDRAS